MCGIAGFSKCLVAATQVSHDLLAQTTERLGHRGPDSSGSYLSFDGRVALVHTRLSIQDLSPLGHQPMVGSDGRVVLVLNGEIYNFRELRSDLASAGYAFRGHSDTEVLLQLYLEGRTHNVDPLAFLSRLNGIFAFAVWDADLQKLLLARDALGVKPLYFSTSANGFAFASELKALQLLQPPPGALDISALDRYLTFLWCPGEQTPLQSVKQLGPGEALVVQGGAITQHKKWFQLPFFPSVGQATSGSNLSKQAAISGTESHLRRAVHRQLMADVPVGAFLSGGLDSSSVVAFARELNPDIRCFTIEAVGAAEEGMADDLPYARQVAKHLKVPLEVVRIDASRMAHDLPAMVAQCDEPLADPAPLNVLYISRLAREQGIKILLSGAGGDDLFTGYRRHRALIAEKYWSWLPKAARLGLERLTGGLDTTKPLNRRLRKFFNGAGLEGDERLVNYFSWIDRADLTALCSAEFKAALGDSRAKQPMLDFLAELPPDTDRLERMLALEQRFFLADHNLLYTDKMSMAVGVEVRVPFLDLDLVQFAATIPAKFKQRGSEGKWVLKKAMEPHLPREVIYRPKSGFGVPLRRWMRVELRELLGDILGEGSLRKRGLFNPAAVQKLIRANDQGKVDASYSLLSLMCIELWCRHFIDHPGAPVPEFSKAVGLSD
jgi:asparagine synthase (glutamine-hydrolysing)